MSIIYCKMTINSSLINVCLLCKQIFGQGVPPPCR
eukprot:UN13498